jgi:hypothetical protein
MEFLQITGDILHFFYQTLPLIFFGFLCANTLRATGYLDHAGIPMRSVARAAHLPSSCAPALTLFFLSSWSGMGMLSHFFHEQKMEKRSIFVSVMIAQFPKAIHSVIFFQGPLVFSLLGQVIGGVLIGSELVMNFFITVIGILAGRRILRIPPEIQPGSGDIPIHTQETCDKTWLATTYAILKDTFGEFFQIVRVLIPTGIVLILLIDLGISTVVSSILDPIMNLVSLPSFTIIVLASALVSQIAVITSAGTLVAMDGITTIQCLLILFIARAIHLGIGYLKTSLPTNISLFGPVLGPRVTGLECLLTESWIGIMIVVVFGMPWFT